MKKYSTVLRVISLLLVHSFLLEQAAFAAPDFKPTKVDLFVKPAVDLGLPASIASVEDAYQSSVPGEKKIYLIQDAHTNTSGQFNLSRTLDLLLEKDKKIQYVFVEAGFGDSSLSFFRQYGTAESRQKAAEPFLRAGELHGEEYLDLTSDKPFTVWGVEDLGLYKKSLEDYRYVAQKREKFSAYISRVQSTIDTLKPRIYNASLLSFDARYQKYLKEETPLTEYFESLRFQALRLGIDLQVYPALKALKNLKDKETAIDFKKANEEQQKAVAGLSEADRSEFQRLSASGHSPFKLSGTEHVEDKAFYIFLEDKLMSSAPASGWSASGGKSLIGDHSQFSELFKYFEYLKLAQSFKAQAVLTEIKSLENEVFAGLASSPDEKTLMRSQSTVRFLKKLFELTMTPEEYKEYKTLSSPRSLIGDRSQGYDSRLKHSGMTGEADSFNITHLTGFLNKKIMDFKTYYERAVFLEPGYEAIVHKAEHFYELTYSRDTRFIEKTIAKMDLESQSHAVLITGGFHTPNLKSLLKARNASYISITPQVLQETNQKRYEDILLSQWKGKTQPPASMKIPSMAATDRTVSQAALALYPGQFSRPSVLLILMNRVMPGSENAIMARYAQGRKISTSIKTASAARLAQVESSNNFPEVGSEGGMLFNLKRQIDTTLKRLSLLGVTDFSDLSKVPDGRELEAFIETAKRDFAKETDNGRTVREYISNAKVHAARLATEDRQKTLTRLQKQRENLPIAAISFITFTAAFIVAVIISINEGRSLFQWGSLIFIAAIGASGYYTHIAWTAMTATYRMVVKEGAEKEMFSMAENLRWKKPADMVSYIQKDPVIRKEAFRLMASHLVLPELLDKGILFDFSRYFLAERLGLLGISFQSKEKIENLKVAIHESAARAYIKVYAALPKTMRDEIGIDPSVRALLAEFPRGARLAASVRTKDFEFLNGSNIKDVKAMTVGSGRFLLGALSVLQDSGYQGKAVIAQPRSVASADELIANDGSYSLVLNKFDGSTSESRRIEGAIAAAGSLSDEESKKKYYALASDPNLSLDMILVGVMEGGLSVKSQAMKDLTELLVRYFIAHDGKSAPWLINTDNVEWNGDLILKIVKELASDPALGLAGGRKDQFEQWLETVITNTMVDRIVVEDGAKGPNGQTLSPTTVVTEEIPLLFLTIAPYKEGTPVPAALQAVLDKNPHIKLRTRPALQKDYALKLRVLNSIHTLMAHMSVSMGIEFTKQSVANSDMHDLVRLVFENDILPALLKDSALSGDGEGHIRAYFDEWLRRLANPAVNHKNLSIATNGFTKFQQRIEPTMLGRSEVSDAMAFITATILYQMTPRSHSETDGVTKYFMGENLTGNEIKEDLPQCRPLLGMLENLKQSSDMSHDFREILKRLSNNAPLFEQASVVDRIQKFYRQLSQGQTTASLLNQLLDKDPGLSVTFHRVPGVEGVVFRRIVHEGKNLPWIVVTEAIDEKALDELVKSGKFNVDVVDRDLGRRLRGDELNAVGLAKNTEGTGYTAILSFTSHPTAQNEAFFEAFPELKYITLWARGFNSVNVDNPELSRRGIQVSNIGDYLPDAMAEQAMAMTLEAHYGLLNVKAANPEESLINLEEALQNAASDQDRANILWGLLLNQTVRLEDMYKFGKSAQFNGAGVYQDDTVLHSQLGGRRLVILGRGPIGEALFKLAVDYGMDPVYADSLSENLTGENTSVIRLPGASAVGQANASIAIDPSTLFISNEKAKGFSKPLTGRVLGTFSFGSIAQRISKRALAHGLKVQALVRNIEKDKELAAQADLDVEFFHISESDKKEEFLNGVNIIMPLAPLVKGQTEDFINAETLALMKNLEILVNVSRGGLVNEQDLIDYLTKAVRDIQVRLDVLVKESDAPNNPLLKFLNVECSGHTGSAVELIRLLMQMTAINDNLLAAVDGSSVDNPVATKSHQAPAAPLATSPRWFGLRHEILRHIHEASSQLDIASRLISTEEARDDFFRGYAAYLPGKGSLGGAFNPSEEDEFITNFLDANIESVKQLVDKWRANLLTGTVTDGLVAFESPFGADLFLTLSASALFELEEARKLRDSDLDVPAFLALAAQQRGTGESDSRIALVLENNQATVLNLHVQGTDLVATAENTEPIVIRDYKLVQAGNQKTAEISQQDAIRLIRETEASILKTLQGTGYADSAKAAYITIDLDALNNEDFTVNLQQLTLKLIQLRKNPIFRNVSFGLRSKNESVIRQAQLELESQADPNNENGIIGKLVKGSKAALVSEVTAILADLRKELFAAQASSEVSSVDLISDKNSLIQGTNRPSFPMAVLKKGEVTVFTEIDLAIAYARTGKMTDPLAGAYQTLAHLSAADFGRYRAFLALMAAGKGIGENNAEQIIAALALKPLLANFGARLALYNMMVRQFGQSA